MRRQSEFKIRNLTSSSQYNMHILCFVTTIYVEISRKEHLEKLHQNHAHNPKTLLLRAWFMIDHAYLIVIVVFDFVLI